MLFNLNCQTNHQVPSIVPAASQNDTLHVLLTKECDELISQNMVLFVTSDSCLYLPGKTHVSPILYCEKFSVRQIEDWFAARKKIVSELDWEKELAIIQDNITNNSVKVEATLTEYRSSPKWFGHKSLIWLLGFFIKTIMQKIEMNNLNFFKD